MNSERLLPGKSWAQRERYRVILIAFDFLCRIEAVRQLQGEMYKILGCSKLKMTEGNPQCEAYELKIERLWCYQVFHLCSFLILHNVQRALVVEAYDTITASSPICQVTPVTYYTFKPLLSSYPTQPSFSGTMYYLHFTALSPRKFHECSLQSYHSY